MSEMKNYPVEFVERTIALINKFYDQSMEEDLEATFLLNCTLGMIVATSERIKKPTNKGVFSKRICEFDEQVHFPHKIAYIDITRALKRNREEINKISLLDRENCDAPITYQIPIDGRKQARNMELYKLLTKIRNGVAHQNIEPINSKNSWGAIRIWNVNNGIKDFEIEFTILELKNFALFLAQKYVEEFSKRGA